MIFVPITIALGLGLLASSRGARRRRVKRNPEMFTWKISPAVLAELFNNEIENISMEERTPGPDLEMAQAIEKAYEKGPAKAVLSFDASWKLHGALDNLQDISEDGGYRALARAARKLRDQIATTLNESNTGVVDSEKHPGKFCVVVKGKYLRDAEGKSRVFATEAEAEKHIPRSNPNLGNTGREFKQHAALRIWQDMIEKETGKQLTLDQVKDALRMMERDLRMKAFRVIEGKKRRANPMGLRAVDALVSLCKRKYGGQAAGWAADFAEVCRRGTPQKRLWAQVAQALKRQMYANPRPKRRTR